MFKDLINLFTKPKDQVKQSFDRMEVLALTAIFIRIAKLDGTFDINEREKIKELIIKRFEFNEENTENVLNMAARLEGQSNDNVQFIKVIKESIAYEERFNLLKDSWILVMADGKRTYEEDGFMRLFCSLLGLSDKDSALARQFVLKEQKTN
tara:strand:+ start:236 stop:691 length:456 start_codon:yes stop_codon:yes gene_type:complete